MNLASDSEEDYIGPATSNRGRKLKRNAREVYQGKLGVVPNDGHGVKVIEYAGQRRAVVYKRRKTVLDEEDQHEAAYDESEEEEEEENPYNSIKLNELLAPVSHPSQLPSHAAISQTYKSNSINILAARALEVITEEQKRAIQLSKLMSVFLGDDPSYILSERLNLPAYNLDDEENEEKEQDEVKNEGLVNGNGKENGEADGHVRRIITRNQAIIESSVDPFFEAPQIKIDRDFGVPREESDQTRQLVQIAQQRSEEFIRCMTSVREGLLRAQRRKRQVYKWCLETAGQEYVFLSDEEDQNNNNINDDKSRAQDRNKNEAALETENTTTVQSDEEENNSGDEEEIKS